MARDNSVWSQPSNAGEVVYRHEEADNNPEQYEEVDHPAHYGGADNPYELLKVALAWEDMFGLTNLVFQAIKYLVRAGRKPGVTGRTDLKKAIFCIEREMEHRYPE